MRAYFFGNMYLSSIQQGIQAAHVTAEMFTKLHESEDAFMYLLEWATNHKTMILLNAGYSEEIRSLVEMFDSTDNPYPWASFNEGKDALDGALTCVGIILPEKIYRIAELNRKEVKEQTEVAEWRRLVGDCSRWELSVVDRLPRYGLAK